MTQVKFDSKKKNSGECSTGASVGSVSGSVASSIAESNAGPSGIFAANLSKVPTAGSSTDSSLESASESSETASSVASGVPPRGASAVFSFDAGLDNEALRRRVELDYLMSNTFNAILHIEEKSLQNKLTEGLTITEVHTIAAIGLYETNPMNVVAARLNVTLATLTTAVNKLVKKGFIDRERCSKDRRKVLIRLTKQGRQVFRVHDLFHKRMIGDALSGLSLEEEEVFSKALQKVKLFFEESAERYENK